MLQQLLMPWRISGIGDGHLPAPVAFANRACERRGYQAQLHVLTRVAQKQLSAFGSICVALIVEMEIGNMCLYI